MSQVQITPIFEPRTWTYLDSLKSIALIDDRKFAILQAGGLNTPNEDTE
jgi:hypothetical protein